MFKKKKEKKDKTLIFCIYDEINNIKTLPKFTKILGGKDNKNQDIIFQTDETTQISNLKIKTIRTILYSEITLNNIDKFPTSHIEIATYDMFDVYSKNQKLYLFSKKDSNAAILSKSKNKNPFSLVFFSSILKLQEGEREISIKFYPTKFSLQYLLKALKKLNLFIGNENDSLKIFANILLKTIVFQYTTIDKIVVIDKKNITFLWSEDEKAFIANIKINADMPSFMSTEEENLKIDNKGLYLQMIYVNAALSWSSTLFQNLAFSSIKISVKVKNCKSLILQNDFGLIENNISFEPFGPMPKVGSSFFIGSEEIFNNNLKDLKLNIEWDNLPENFEKHYQNYGINIKNSDFNINISFLQPRILASSSPRHRLFFYLLFSLFFLLFIFLFLSFYLLFFFLSFFSLYLFFYLFFSFFSSFISSNPQPSRVILVSSTRLPLVISLPSIRSQLVLSLYSFRPHLFNPPCTSCHPRVLHSYSTRFPSHPPFLVSHHLHIIFASSTRLLLLLSSSSSHPLILLP